MTKNGAQKYGHAYGGHMDERKSAKNTIREIIKKNIYLQVTIIKIIIII
jgi:ribosomal protein L35